MAERKRAEQVAKNRQARAFPPAAEEEFIASSPTVDADVSPLVQRAQRDPAALKPNEVIQLQRLIGNRAVTQMLGVRGKPSTAINRKATPAPAIQRHYKEEERPTPDAVDHEVDLGLETALASHITDAPAMAVQRGFFTRKKGGNASGGEIRAVVKTGTTGLSVYLAVKRGLQILKGIKKATGGLYKGALNEFANLLSGLGIPGFLSLIKRIYDAITTYLNMEGLKEGYDKLRAKEKTAPLTPDEANLKEAAWHGLSKVIKRFYKALYLVISSVVKITSHFITALSGGTAAMVSEVVGLGATLLEGLQTAYEKVKGFVKWVRNKRGTHRKQSAERIIHSALDNQDPIALKILVDLNAYSFIRNEKFALKHGHGGVETPETPDEMYDLLVTFRDQPEKYGKLADYKKDVAKKLKSA